MNASLQEVDRAIAALAEGNCHRDPDSGQWLTESGLALGTNPVQAAHNLRHSIIKSAVEKQRQSGRHFTR